MTTMDLLVDVTGATLLGIVLILEHLLKEKYPDLFRDQIGPGADRLLTISNTIFRSPINDLHSSCIQYTYNKYIDFP